MLTIFLMMSKRFYLAHGLAKLMATWWTRFLKSLQQQEKVFLSFRFLNRENGLKESATRIKALW